MHQPGTRRYRRPAPLFLAGLMMALVVTACDDSNAPVEATTSEAGTARTTVTTAPPGTDSPGGTTPPPHDVDGFLNRLVAAVSAGDTGQLWATLHPLAREVYGRERCEGFIDDIAGAQIVASLDSDELRPIDVDLDGHRRSLAAWSADLDDLGRQLMGSEALTVAVTPQGTLGWLADCGRVLITVEPGGLLIASISHDTRSEPFDAPDSWRVEAMTATPCSVVLHDEPAGTSEELGSDDSSFVVQMGGTGVFSVETIGCGTVTVIANTSDT